MDNSYGLLVFNMALNRGFRGELVQTLRLGIEDEAPVSPSPSRSWNRDPG